MTKEALELVLEVLENLPGFRADIDNAKDVIKAALAQPAQEPFGYLSIGGNPIFQKEKPEIGRWETLYTTPPQRTWVVLTDKEIEAIWKVALFADYGVGAELSNQPFVHYARAIESKLRGKNNG